MRMSSFRALRKPKMIVRRTLLLPLRKVRGGKHNRDAKRQTLLQIPHELQGEPGRL